MENCVLSIVHITDLHLFVDEAGDARPPSEQATSVRFFVASAKKSGAQFIKDQVSGFSLPNFKAWNKLRQRIPDIVKDERKALGPNVPLLVLQTGDVETFGRSDLRAARGEDPFPGFKYLRTVLWPNIKSAGATAIVDLYGNHDVWSGTFPLLTPIKHVRNASRRIATVDGLKGPWPDRQDFPAPSGLRIELYRLNSVSPGSLRGSLATGSVEPHPPFTKLPLSKSRDAIRELYALALQSKGFASRPIRVIAMHHPPHFFGDDVFTRLTSGRVVGADGIARFVSNWQTHLIVAGHRHALDPAVGSVHVGSQPDFNQYPLSSSTGQLVSESPTADSDLAAIPSPKSIAIYRVHADDATKRVRVERSIRRYGDSMALPFSAGPFHDVFKDIPL